MQRGVGLCDGVAMQRPVVQARGDRLGADSFLFGQMRFQFSQGDPADEVKLIMASRVRLFGFLPVHSMISSPAISAA